MTSFLIALVCTSGSVTLLLVAFLAALRPLLARYRAGTLHLTGLLLVALLLAPWRPALLPDMPIPTWVESTPNAVQTQVSSEPMGLVEILEMPVIPEMSEPAVAKTGGAKIPVEWEQPATPLSHRVRWDALLMALWVVGALAALVTRAAKHLRFVRMLRRWRRPPEEPYRAVLEAECARMGLQEMPAWRTSLVYSPAVFGLIHPALLASDTEIPMEQWTLVVRHELTHIKRKDLWAKALIELALAVHWFNPALIWARRRLSTLCEMACDEAVLAGRSMEERGIYLEAMLGALSTVALPALSTRFDGGIKNMKLRLERLFELRQRKRGIGVLALVLVLALCTGNVLAVSESALKAQPERAPLEDFADPEDRMTDEEYAFVMGFDTADTDSLTLAAWWDQLRPNMVQLNSIFEKRVCENEFMSRLVTLDMEDLTRAKYVPRSVRELLLMVHDEPSGPTQYWFVTYTPYWEIPDPTRVTVGQRNRVFADIGAQLRKRFGELVIAGESKEQIQEDLTAFGKQLTEQPDMGVKLVRIMVGWPTTEDGELYGDISEADMEYLLNLQMPGYLDMSVQAFDESIAEELARIENIMRNGYSNHWFVQTLQRSLSPGYFSSVSGNDGTPDFNYEMAWNVHDPVVLTVRERDMRVIELTERIWLEAVPAAKRAGPIEENTAAMKAIVERLADELSDDKLSFQISNPRFELKQT